MFVIRIEDVGCPSVKRIAFTADAPAPVDVKYISCLEPLVRRVVHVEPPLVDTSIVHDAGAQDIFPNDIPI